MKILTCLSESAEPLLPIALIIARGYVLLMALAGEIFGQLFFGIFSLSATITGVSAILAGTLGGLHCRDNPTMGRFVMFCCLAALGGTVAGAIHYYSDLNIPGNDFAWELRALFVISLLLISYVALPFNKPSNWRSN